MKKLAVIAAASVVVASGGLVGVGQAAAVPIPHVYGSGSSFATFGDHSFCHGTVNIRADAPPNKRGVVRVTATSAGFTGNGATWKRNPKCRVLFGTLYNGSRGLNMEKWVTGSFGPRRGDKKVWEVRTGSGPASVGVATYSASSPVRLQQGYGTGIYLLVP
ncbi:enoyl-CoA hydratase [Gordonia amicalis]|uniref:enoyl-CoA hydratase n=1 Tax=Gordonia amicalis TaxID=89053 RepID=UPI00217548ED|nr:enoyl-CoA hydratase [Gordonia amicalis]MCZ0911259.1 enoyl-CoA hydratase [Gordonia amicalis]MDV7101640.1 enoyl-CoA hydratase [Gordonia amicalis]MDV7172711.1 enoyl-CoA hydratase [Gordonia amicalis]